MSAANYLGDNKINFMTKYKLLIFFSLIIFAVNCGGNASNGNNQNVNASAGRTVSDNATTTSVNENKDQPVEVPKFNEANAALEAGKKFFESDEDEKAVKALEQAVELDPNLPEAQFQLALAYDAVDNQEAAEKSYNAAIKAYLSYLKKNPKDAAAQFNLGRSYGKMNEDEKAQKAMQQAIKLKPEDGEYHFELGTILIKLAKYSEAIKELKKSLELDPENTRAEAALEKAESGNDRVAASQIKNKEAKTAPAKTIQPKNNQNSNAQSNSSTSGDVKKIVNANSAP